MPWKPSSMIMKPGLETGFGSEIFPKTLMYIYIHDRERDEKTFKEIKKGGESFHKGKNRLSEYEVKAARDSMCDF